MIRIRKPDDDLHGVLGLRHFDRELVVEGLDFLRRLDLVVEIGIPLEQTSKSPVSTSPWARSASKLKSPPGWTTNFSRADQRRGFPLAGLEKRTIRRDQAGEGEQDDERGIGGCSSFVKADISGGSAQHHDWAATVDGALEASGIIELMSVETEIAAQASRRAGRVDIHRHRCVQPQVNAASLGGDF